MVGNWYGRLGNVVGIERQMMSDNTCRTCKYWQRIDETTGECRRMCVHHEKGGHLLTCVDFCGAAGNLINTSSYFGCSKFEPKPKGPFSVQVDECEGQVVYNLILGGYRAILPINDFPLVRSREAMQYLADTLNSIWPRDECQ